MTWIFIFLLAITAAEVIKVALEIFKGGVCPIESELNEFLIGQIDKDSAKGEKISRHLGICKECQRNITLL